uniref:Uncharacterized protein n=1 Tax=Astyanax mexicanus TaxID=7994 RepID=A0A3B1JW58_ASTMX
MEVLQDAEGEALKYKPGGRLDMSHGFLHHIRRNQIAREHQDWQIRHWRLVLFTDESRFTLST